MTDKTKVIVIDHTKVMYALHRHIISGGDEPKKGKKDKKGDEIEGSALGLVVTEFTDSGNSSDPYAALDRNSYMLKPRTP